MFGFLYAQRAPSKAQARYAGILSPSHWRGKELAPPAPPAPFDRRSPAPCPSGAAPDVASHDDSVQGASRQAREPCKGRGARFRRREVAISRRVRLFGRPGRRGLAAGALGSAVPSDHCFERFELRQLPQGEKECTLDRMCALATPRSSRQRAPRSPLSSRRGRPQATRAYAIYTRLRTRAHGGWHFES